jgi:hypothetical protein
MTAVAIEVRERPVLFKGEMVKAILENKKTQTRRVVKPQPFELEEDGELEGGWYEWGWKYGASKTTAPKSCFWHAATWQKNVGTAPIDKFCPYGKPGDRLWVRESLWVSDCGNYYARPYHGGFSTDYDILAKDGSKEWLTNRYIPTGFDDTDKRHIYPEFPHMTTSWHNEGKTLRSGRYIEAFSMGFADLDTSVKIEPLTGNTITHHYEATFRKRISSIFMPRWASRITLEVTGVRVERLKQISLEDVEAEGTPISPIKYRGKYARFEDFKILWNSINGKKYPYETSPWVWVISFKRLEPAQAESEGV